MKSKIHPGVPTANKVVHSSQEKQSSAGLNAKAYYLIIIALAFILYGNTIQNNYSLDDSYVTSINPVVQKGIKAIPQIFTSNYITMNAEEGGQHSYGYRPVAKATFAIERSLFGENPHMSHFINVLLYALTGLLLFIILRKLLKKHHIMLPFLTVLFFMVHPLHTEVVASLKNREELLSFLGALGSIYFFMKWHETDNKKFILLALLSFALGYLSKVNIMTFIIIIPLIFWYFTDTKPRKLLLTSLMVIGVIALMVLIPRVLLGTAVRPMQFIENPLQFEPTLPERLGTSMMVLLFYLKMLVFPHPLLFYYGYNMIPVTTIENPIVWLSFIIHAGLFGFAVYTIRRKSIFSFAILFYLINIGIFSNLLAPPTGIVAERFMYIASLGFCLALAYGLFRILKINTTHNAIPAKAIAWITGIAFLISIPAAAKVIDRNKDWKNEMTLYEADMPYLEKSAKANFIYATNLRSSIVSRLKAGVPRKNIVNDAQTSIKHFKRAVAVYPEYPDAWNNLGESFLLLLNEADSSIKYFEKAVEVNPRLHAAFYNLGYTYQVTGNFEKAVVNYEKALELEPWEVRTMSNLSVVYGKTGQIEKAIQLNEDIIKIEPGMEAPYLNLASFAIQQGDNITALGYFEKALEVNPNNFNLSMRLNDYYKRAGDTLKAEYYLDIARRAQK